MLQEHSFKVRCAVDEQTGRLLGKIEYCGGERDEYGYTFDAKGHLCRACLNLFPLEEYRYDALGRRVFAKNGIDGSRTHYVYNEKNQLIRAGETTFAYNSQGSLAAQKNERKELFFNYDQIFLNSVILPDGQCLRYEYDQNSPNPFGPARKFKGDILAAKYLWKNLGVLGTCIDYATGLIYKFTYDKRGALNTVTLTGFRPNPLLQKKDEVAALWDDVYGPEPEDERSGLARRFGPKAREVTLLCGCDQVGTPKMFTLANGALIKKVKYNSFGMLFKDTNPELFIPIGFAGGLLDRDTGLVRFGCRDYHPQLGRFLSPDPLGDTGGDHDVYDYCVDDPVSLKDPTGLYAVPAKPSTTAPLTIESVGRFLSKRSPFWPFLAVKHTGKAIALETLKPFFSFADYLKEKQTGKESTTARDGLQKISDKLDDVFNLSKLPMGLRYDAPSTVLDAASRYFEEREKAKKIKKE